MELAQGTTESAASLEEISSSLSEISEQIKISSNHAVAINQSAQDARQVSLDGKKQMDKMLESMLDIKSSGREIEKIIKVIDEIAFQARQQNLWRYSGSGNLPSS